MHRDILTELETWQKHPYRKPLIMRGARQVGKSWVVNKFSKRFEHFISINFESARDAHSIFSGQLNAKTVLEKLALYTGKKITPDNTLLFFDEIQACPNALLALRYFKEESPELHVIAAGSLIDFILKKVGMPVGRVQFMYLYPLSFGEFLTVNQRDDLRQHILSQGVDAVTHQYIMGYLKTYLWLGGMPAVVSAWLEHGNPALCHEIQDEIIDAYYQDFHKYATDTQIPYLNKVFDSIPVQLGKKFKYVNVDSDVHSRPLKEALMLLNQAGIAYYCYHTSAQTQPLAASVDNKKFKTFLFDIGLAQRLLGLDTRTWLNTEVSIDNIGAIAEQLVAQELMAYGDARKKSSLYYWHREARASNAEVDFLVLKNNHIVPIEVKSGSSGRMRSLHLYLESHPSPYGLKIAEHLFSKNNHIQEIPLYGLEAWLLASDSAPNFT